MQRRELSSCLIPFQCSSVRTNGPLKQRISTGTLDTEGCQIFPRKVNPRFFFPCQHVETRLVCSRKSITNYWWSNMFLSTCHRAGFQPLPSLWLRTKGQRAKRVGGLKTRNGSGPLSEAGRLLADLAETVVRVSLSDLRSRSILLKKDLVHPHIPSAHNRPSVTGRVSIGDLKK